MAGTILMDKGTEMVCQDQQPLKGTWSEMRLPMIPSESSKQHHGKERDFRHHSCELQMVGHWTL
jgi:hypothetical protein